MIIFISKISSIHYAKKKIYQIKKDFFKEKVDLSTPSV